MPATGFTHPLLSELAHRVSIGTDVTLSWNERTGAPAVSVRNRGTGALVQFTPRPTRPCTPSTTHTPTPYRRARTERAHHLLRWRDRNGLAARLLEPTSH